MNEFEQCIDEWATRCREKDAQITSLQAALDAELEKVKGLHEITKVICTHCCEPMEIPSKAVLQTQLTQLQALVRALVAKLDESDKASQGIFITAAMHGIHYNGPSYADELQALKAATLDATTPAAKGGDGE